MWKRRSAAIILAVVLSLAFFFQAAGQSQHLRNGLQALVYHAMQIERYFPELDPLGAAADELERAVLSGEGDEALLLLGLVYQNLAAEREAAGAYELYLSRNPEEAWVYALIGDAYLQAGDYSLAEEAYAMAAESGSLARAYYGLGSVFLDRQDYQAAKEAFEKALEEAPDFTAARVGLGVSLYYLAQYEEAVEVLELSQLLDPRSLEVHQFLALTYEALGRAEQAQHARERIEQLTP